MGSGVQGHSWRSGSPRGIERGGRLMQRTNVYRCILICVYTWEMYHSGKHSDASQDPKQRLGNSCVTLISRFVLGQEFEIEIQGQLCDANL